MADTLLPDNPQTLERLQSVACLMDWMGSMGASDRRRFMEALTNCSGKSWQMIRQLMSLVEAPGTPPNEREHALSSISAMLFSAEREGSEKSDDMATQQELFVTRLREMMERGHVSQQELARRVGCSQPAISQLLGRKRRPHKKTILKVAASLQVDPRELWPDLETLDLLDCVAEFQQDDYVMTDEEANALRVTTEPNRPKLEPTSLPARHR